MRRLRRLAIVVPLAVAAASAGTVFLPFYAVGPGPARAVQPLIRFEDRPRYESEGRFVLTSIRYDQLTAFGVLAAWLDPDRSVVPRSELFGPGESVERERERAISQMDQSKLDAAYVVLRELTGYPKEHGEGVLVESVVDGCAADGELFPGDLILAIDGEPVGRVREARRLIEAAPAGSALTFDVTVDGEPERVRLVREPCGGEPRPLVGVSLINSFPFEVRIASGDIGGPSAGLMWALGLYDLLTPGDLTGGRTVAGTGVLAIDGTVHAVGGVRDKVAAAAGSGADIFLVPADDLEEARSAGDRGVELVPVGSFGEALEYLRATG